MSAMSLTPVSFDWRDGPDLPQGSSGKGEAGHKGCVKTPSAMHRGVPPAAERLPNGDAGGIDWR
jgi:hypothetical protein